MEFNALWTKQMALGLAGMALIWTATTAQAQLTIHVYPSQDDPTKTLWIFGNTGEALPFTEAPSELTQTISTDETLGRRRLLFTPTTNQPSSCFLFLLCPVQATQKTSIR